jgi:hypothetical protein
MQTFARYIQGIRLYCGKCNKSVTPVTIILNDTIKDGDDSRTIELQFDCDTCKMIIKRVKI